MLDRFNAQTFSAVGTAVWQMNQPNAFATKVCFQFAGSGNFSATCKLNNFDNDTDWTDCTSSFFGIGAITTFGYYSAQNWDLPGRVSISVDSVQAAHTIKIAQGWQG